MDFAITYKPKDWQFPHLFLLSLCLTSWHSNAILLGFDRTDPPNFQAFGPAAIADSPDIIFIETLIQQGFADLATEICQTRRRLAKDSQGSSDAIARWSMLLIHSIAAQAVSNESFFDKPTLIDAVLSKASSVAIESPDAPRHIWVKYKLQWSRHFVLQRTLAACLAVPSREALREWSLQSVRSCLDELDRLQVQAKNSPIRGGGSGSKDIPTPSQWTSLENDIILLEADLLLLRGGFYPMESQERIGAAAELIDLLDRAAAQINSDWPGYPRLELTRCNALFMLGRLQESMNELQKLWTRLADTPKSKGAAVERWQLGVGALAAQVNREMGNVRESDRWIELVGGPFRSPEVALEHFANRLVIPSNAPNSSTPEVELQNAQLQLAFEVKAEIGKRFGAYWQQRADAILVSNKVASDSSDSSTSMQPGANTTSTSGNLRVELLKTEAKQLLAGDQWQKAIDKLNQAEMSAANSGNETEALDIAMKSAAILMNKGQDEVARSEFFRSAIAYQRSVKAPDAAMMSVWKMDSVKADDSVPSSGEELLAIQQERKAIYRGRLAEILATWPESSHADRATQKLEQSFLAEDQLVPILELWTNRLVRLPEAAVTSTGGESSWTAYDLALTRYALIAIASRSAWPDRTLYRDQELIQLREALKQLRMRIVEKSPANAKPIAEAWLQSIDEWLEWPRSDSSLIPKTSPIQDLPISLRYLESEEAIDLRTKLAPHALASFMALGWIRAEVQYQQQIRQPNDANGIGLLKNEMDRLRELLSKEPQAVEFLIGARQSDQLKKSLESYSAAIEFWSGEENQMKALESLSTLRKRNPKNPWWAYRSARILQSDPSQRGAAIQLYRTLASGFAAGSDEWLEMRARTAQTMRQMGDLKSAQELADLVLATYPTMTDEWKRRFAP